MHDSTAAAARGSCSLLFKLRDELGWQGGLSQTTEGLAAFSVARNDAVVALFQYTRAFGKARRHTSAQFRSLSIIAIVCQPALSQPTDTAPHPANTSNIVIRRLFPLSCACLLDRCDELPLAGCLAGVAFFGRTSSAAKGPPCLASMSAFKFTRSDCRVPIPNKAALPSRGVDFVSACPVIFFLVPSGRRIVISLSSPRGSIVPESVRTPVGTALLLGGAG